MPEDVQTLVDELRGLRDAASDVAGRAATALEAAYSLPPACPAQREALVRQAIFDYDSAAGHDDGLIAAQRPPLSPEQREELEWAGIKALVESAEVPTGVRGLLLGEVFTIREAVDAEVVVQVILDAILPRFSVPSQPVYDEERLADWFATFAVQTNPYGLSIPIDQAHEAAAALVAALRGGELTREETNE